MAPPEVRSDSLAALKAGSGTWVPSLAVTEAGDAVATVAAPMEDVADEAEAEAYVEDGEEAWAWGDRLLFGSDAGVVLEAGIALCDCGEGCCTEEDTAAVEAPTK